MPTKSDRLSKEIQDKIYAAMRNKTPLECFEIVELELIAARKNYIATQTTVGEYIFDLGKKGVRAGLPKVVEEMASALLVFSEILQIYMHLVTTQKPVIERAVEVVKASAEVLKNMEKLH